MKAFYKKLATALMMLGFAGLVTEDSVAQNFTNTGAGTYNATCGAVLKMKSENGTITTTGSVPIGTDAGSAIDGVVEWSKSSGNQNIGAYYYNSLILSGASTKAVPTGIFVVGTQCPDFLTGYNQLNNYPYVVTGTSGAVTYTGTFTYGGTNQNIFPQTNYNVLDVTGTTPTILATDDVTAVEVNTNAGTELEILGDLTLGAGTSDFAGVLNVGTTGTLTTGSGTVNVDNNLVSSGVITTAAGNVIVDGTATLTAGTLNVNGVGDVTFNGTSSTSDGNVINVNSTGDLTFGGNLNLAGDIVVPGGGAGGYGNVNFDGTTAIAATGTLNFGQNTNLLITGDITNAGDGTNLLFNCGSTTTYDGTQNPQIVLPTLDADGNRYGDLVLTGGAKRGGTNATGINVNVCDDFSLTGGNFDMLTNNGYLKLNDPTGSVTYGAGTDAWEVVGKMRRTYATSTDSYVFNNYKTTLAFTTDAAAAGYYEFSVVPGATGAPIFTDANTVDRKITMSYDLTGWVATIQAGYLASELPAFAGGLTENNLKFFEADGALDTDIEKLSGVLTRNTSDNIRHLNIAGVLPGTGAVDGVVEKEFTSGNDLLLRANNTMYSIADGRWTNPNTWDEGVVPTATDNAEVRNSVYVGIDGPFIGTLAAGNTTSEFDHYAGNDAAANTITIAAKTGSANPALIIGNEDNPATYLFKTAATGTSFTNNNTTANVTVFPIDPLVTTKGSLASGNIQGLWLVPYITAGSIPALSTTQISNAGNINNQGIIEIGE